MADAVELSLEELRRLYLDEEGPLPRGLLASLRDDPRQGAQELARRLDERAHAARAEGRRLARLSGLEEELYAAGARHIAGVDEAGAGPLAGPVVAAAVILPRGVRPRGVDDSKKLDAETREGLAQEIRGVAVAVGVGVAEVDEIDKLNIYQAALLAMQRALKRLAVAPDRVLTDARRVPGVSVPQHNIIKGDARCLCIAAASIIAKTHRDGLMDGLDRAHPGYGFAQHKGYATPEHMEALLALGPSPVHRRSFAPVKDLLAGAETSAQRDLFKR